MLTIYEFKYVSFNFKKSIVQLQKTDEDWLLSAGSSAAGDTLCTTISAVAHLIGKTLANDISNLPPQYKVCRFQ